METETIYRHLVSLKSSSSAQALRLNLGELSRSLGFDWFVFALKRPEAPKSERFTLLNGYSEAWIEHYFSNDLPKDDPVMQHCVTRSTPLDWLSLELTAGSKEAMLMDVASEFGLKSGVSYPLHGPQGDFGVLSFSAAQRGRAAEESVREALPLLPLLSAHLRETLLHLLPNERTDPLCPLS